MKMDDQYRKPCLSWQIPLQGIKPVRKWQNPTGTDPALFPAGHVLSAGLHGLGATLHHVVDGTYDLYLPRTFALSLTEGIVEVAEQWGVEVKG